jgi:DNA-binding response OmpR family regulator
MTLVSEVNIVSGTVAAATRRLAPLRALVMDGDHCLVKAVHQMLEEMGFRTDSANGGLAIMQCLIQFSYDLVITELQMPDMDGHELSGWLKHKSDNCKQTKVIVMTRSNHADVANYMNTGAVDRWMFKPFGLTKLAEILGELVPIEVFRGLKFQPNAEIDENSHLWMGTN